MAAYYQMRELTGGLRVQVHQDLERWQRLLVGGIAAIAVGFPTALFFGGWWWTILSSIVALTAYGVAKGRSAELQITNVEFISRGDIGRRVRTRIVCTGNVRRLEFRQDSRPFSSGYDGLYAVTDNGTICLLPFLDFNTTAEVIRVIESHFPGLAEGWRSGQPISEHVRARNAK